MLRASVGLLSLLLVQTYAITFESNGYKDVVVSISPDISATAPERQQIMDSIKVQHNCKLCFSTFHIFYEHL